MSAVVVMTVCSFIGLRLLVNIGSVSYLVLGAIIVTRPAIQKERAMSQFWVVVDVLGQLVTAGFLRREALVTILTIWSPLKLLIRLCTDSRQTTTWTSYLNKAIYPMTSRRLWSTWSCEVHSLDIITCGPNEGRNSLSQPCTICAGVYDSMILFGRRAIFYSIPLGCQERHCVYLKIHTYIYI